MSAATSMLELEPTAVVLQATAERVVEPAGSKIRAPPDPESRGLAGVVTWKGDVPSLLFCCQSAGRAGSVGSGAPFLPKFWSTTLSVLSLSPRRIPYCGESLIRLFSTVTAPDVCRSSTEPNPTLRLLM